MALTTIKTGGLADNSVTDAKVADAITVTGAQTGITQVGTLTAGTWQGTAIASAYLDSDTAHLSTTQTFSGAKTFTGGLTIDPSGDNYVVMTSGATDANLGFLFKNSSDVQKGFILYDSDDNFLQLGSGNVQALKLDSSQNATFAGDGTLGNKAILEDIAGTNTYTNLQIYKPSNATGFVMASGASNTNARNWGLYTNYSDWGNLDFRVSSARGDAVAHTTQVLSLEKDGDMITQRIMPVADGTHDLGDNTKSWRKVYTDGILFNGDTSNDNMLDDYEEGTYTWKIYTSNGNSSNAEWQSRSGYQLAQYTKIGNMVTVSGRWEVNAQANASTSSDYYVFMTLPLAVAGHGGSQPYSSVGAGTFNRAATGDTDAELKSAKPIVFQGDSYMFWQMASGTSSGESYIMGFSDSNFEGHFCITYRAA